jgi:hypothetical protein
MSGPRLGGTTRTATEAIDIRRQDGLDGQRAALPRQLEHSAVIDLHSDPPQRANDMARIRELLHGPLAPSGCEGRT